MITRTGMILDPARRTERREHTSAFPNQIADGSFTPDSTIVEVGCFRTAEVQEAFSTQNLLPVHRDLQVLCHEMTHWFDFFGTIWGREYAQAIAHGFDAMARGTEDQFASIITLFDQDRRILSPEYYRFARPPQTRHDVSRPWSIDYSCGVEIDAQGVPDENRPIFMARFGENPTRQIFARQPISIGALLEVRAIASELQAGHLAIATRGNVAEEAIARRIMDDEFLGLAYDHRLIEYNAAVHILSVRSGSKEFLLSYRLAAALAYIALNLGPEGFDVLRVPESFADFGPRNAALKRNRDRGFAFACLVFNGGAYAGDETEYVEQCVAQSGLGGVEEILTAARSKLAAPVARSPETPPAMHLIREIAAAPDICDALRARAGHVLTVDMLFGHLRALFPPFMDADAEFIEIHQGRTKAYEPEAMHDAAHALRHFTRNLLSGCRGI